ncbi:RagB/SusD family nutrient uptake outer membrane protein [Prevotella sp.]|uniref:RagB/SusD family nutrient uptake outer membrane protein n=1 Tax=Prevotella sp. TaxID=59823 RepID=UPI002649284D|nr:RagB/SusD family nutrient uptake outer membrane protein [Prevotella sp.]MDN5552953.1 RagB/SusD family nutrient uptake outer membrane protein [Prevotella sp.]
MKLNNILCSSFAVLALVSCNDKMDYNEYNIYDKDYVSKTFNNVGGFMTDIYNTIDYDYGSYGNAIMGSTTDESEFAVSGTSIDDFFNGAWSASNAKNSVWSSMYTGINVCNQVMDKFVGLTFSDYEMNSDYDKQMARYNNYKWEARFWRAYFYFNLAKQYGGVPLITKVQSTKITNTTPRATADETFKFIIDECNLVQDSIVKNPADFNLPSEIDNGRASRITVLALKARAALYWASPLFNPQGDKERYHAAALYTKQLIDECKARGMDLTANYADLWSANNWKDTNITKEIIFGRRIYGSGSNGASNTFESRNYPAGIEGGNGGNCPTQNLVDAYDMKATGLGIGETGSGYVSSNPYAGRDPRLDATVAKNGDVWPTYQKVKLETFYGGVNGQPLSGGTLTGYYVKKLCHGAINLTAKSKYTVDNHTWVTFRLGEFYLNYAEAVFKYLGSADATSAEFPMSAREAASKTRVRAGMPAFPIGMGNDTFWAKYTNERFVELAFEGHRFWDVRRWKEADKYFKEIKEMKLAKNADGSISYTPNTVTRQWDDKMYLFPIPQTEIQKNKNLAQNPGWK